MDFFIFTTVKDGILEYLSFLPLSFICFLLFLKIDKYSYISYNSKRRINLMETFYKHMNNFIWQHPFIKGCIHFTSRFCPYMIIIFYSLFLLKIYIEWQSHLFFFIKNPGV